MMSDEKVKQFVFDIQRTMFCASCDMCGISMKPNPSNTHRRQPTVCTKCLLFPVDTTIIHCPACNTYLQPPNTWIEAELESEELLIFCIKRLYYRVRLVHAEFIWTEPRLKRIKVKLIIGKDAPNRATVEHPYIMEYIQQERLCGSCSRVQVNPDQRVASVHVRQYVPHRRTFFFLEQLILKHGAAERAINVREVYQGIDFFFGNRSHAIKFVEFLGSVVPVRSRSDKQLVSHDLNSNNYNYKHTFSVDICPICRDDLICLPWEVSNNLGNLGPLVLCTKVSNNILLVDPKTLRSAFLDASQYWRSPFKPLLTSRQLVEYLVFDVEVLEVDGQEITTTIDKKDYFLARAEVAQVSDLRRTFTVITHLGHLLKAGHTVLGYDLCGANINDPELEKYKGLILPEVVLIKRSYEEEHKKVHGKSRPWKLKNMKMEVDRSSKWKIHEEKKNTEYEEFLRDLEVDPELRFNISFYRNKERAPSEMASTDEDDEEAVELEDLLAELELKDEGDHDNSDMVE